jgi:hypothetical protein
VILDPDPHSQYGSGSKTSKSLLVLIRNTDAKKLRVTLRVLSMHVPDPDLDLLLYRTVLDAWKELLVDTSIGSTCTVLTSNGGANGVKVHFLLYSFTLSLSVF